MKIVSQINIGPRTLLRLDQALDNSFKNHMTIQIGSYIYHDVMYPSLYDEEDQRQVLMLNQSVKENLVGLPCQWLVESAMNKEEG